MDHQPSTQDSVSRLIKKPFLLIRFIIFLILFFVNISILIFSSWNVIAARNSGYVGPFGPSFSLFSSCAFLFLGLMANVDLVFPSAKTSMVKLELAWTGVLSVLYFAVSFIVTRDGPQFMCRRRVNENVCSSSYLLIPVVWLASFLLFSYFVTLMVLTTIHIQLYPNLHNLPVIHVPWFETSPPLPPSRESKNIDLDLSEDTYEKPRELDLEQQSIEDVRTKVDNWARKRTTVLSVLSVTPQWAKQRNGTIRRGLTNPFALPTQYQPQQLPIPSPIVEEEIQPVAALDKNSDRLSYWLAPGDITLENMTPPKDARVSYRIGQGLYDVDRRGAAAPTPNPPMSDAASVTTSLGEKKMRLRLEDEDRISVSSMFPHSVKSEDWNQPLRKPPFQRGLGGGWRTADNAPKGRVGSR